MMMGVLAEEQNNENEDEALVEASNTSGYETPQKEIGLGATKRPTPLGLSGLSAGPGGEGLKEPSPRSF